MENIAVTSKVLPFKAKVVIAEPKATEMEMALLVDWVALRKQKRWLQLNQGKAEARALCEMLESIQYFAAGIQAAPPELIFDEGDGGPAGVEGNPPNADDDEEKTIISNSPVGPT